MNIVNFGTEVRTMTSREIADLTGKRHDHVLRDIKVMLSELGDTSSQIWGDLPDSYGRMQPCFNLPHREGILSYWVPAEIDAWLSERCDRPRVGPKLADGVTPWQPKATAGEGA